MTTAPAQHFDRIAHRYNQSLPPHVVAHYLERRLALLQRLCPPPGPVLDAGCGTGLLLGALAERGYWVVGIDPSAGMLSEAPPALRGGLALASAAALPFDDGAFPLVVSVAALHHMVAPGVVAEALREMVRVTAPGGATVVWDHNPRNPYWPWIMARVPQDQEPTRLVPEAEVVAGLQRGGDVAVTCQQRGWMPDFMPRWALSTVAALERVLEGMPGVRRFGGHNVIIARKLPVAVSASPRC